MKSTSTFLKLNKKLKSFQNCSKDCWKRRQTIKLWSVTLKNWRTNAKSWKPSWNKKRMNWKLLKMSLEIKKLLLKVLRRLWVKRHQFLPWIRWQRGRLICIRLLKVMKWMNCWLCISTGWRLMFQLGEWEMGSISLEHERFMPRSWTKNLLWE